MRKIATVQQPKDKIKRVMICFDKEDGYYLFLYDTLADGPCCADELYETLAVADRECAERYGITAGHWIVISDNPKGCLADWIIPTRIKRDIHGDPVFGQLEQVDVKNIK